MEPETPEEVGMAAGTTTERTPEEIEREIAGTRASIESTVEELGERLRPTQLVEDARSYVRETASRGASEAWHTVSTTMRENAVPFALIGSGIAWYVMSRRSNGGYHDGGGYREDELGAASYYGHGVGYAETGGYESAGAHEGTLGTSEPGGLQSSAAGMASQAAERARDVTHRVRERSARLGERAKHQAERARHSVSSMLGEQPLLAGIASFALGALAGGLMPPTRREDQWFGRVRDDLLGKAAEAGREKVEQVRHAAEQAAHGAQQGGQGAEPGRGGMQGGPGAQSAPPRGGPTQGMGTSGAVSSGPEGSQATPGSGSRRGSGSATGGA